MIEGLFVYRVSSDVWNAVRRRWYRRGRPRNIDLSEEVFKMLEESRKLAGLS
jgi:hypothetical protein